VRPAFVGAAVLYAFVAILLAATLPAQVPLRFDAHLTADRWATRGGLMLVICTLGALLVGLFAGLAALAGRLRAPLLQLGAVTLVFLAVELALGYGGLGGAVAVDYPSAGVEAAAAQVAVRLPPWTIVLLVGYLAYVLGWLGWVVTRRPRARTGPAQHRASRGTADSSV
jgi:hypothetical protein